MKLTELEIKLADDQCGEQKRKMLMQLDQMYQKIAPLLRQPQVPQQYHTLQLWQQAILAAHEVVTILDNCYRDQRNLKHLQENFYAGKTEPI